MERRRVMGSRARLGAGELPELAKHYELGPDLVRCELRLTTWPGGRERLLGRGDVHLAPVEWLEAP